MGYTDIKAFNETINKRDFDKFFITFISKFISKKLFLIKKSLKVKHIDIVKVLFDKNLIEKLKKKM